MLTRLSLSEQDYIKVVKDNKYIIINNDVLDFLKQD